MFNREAGAKCDVRLGEVRGGNAPVSCRVTFGDAEVARRVFRVVQY